jgi:hypothetical protein
MNNILEGIAVVIDDKIESEDNIKSIVKQIMDKKIPVLKYTEIPEGFELAHSKNASFYLLDWQLYEAAEGTAIPADTIKEYEDEIIGYIKKIYELCFKPVFIFTNQNPDDIISKLKLNDLYFDDKPNFIFVKRKSDLINDQLFNELENWIKKNPPIYILNEWQNKFNGVQNTVFNEFYKVYSGWPEVLLNTFESDHVDAGEKFAEIINRNIMTRVGYLNIDEKIIKQGHNASRDDIIKVLEGERFVKNEYLPKDIIGTGDLFIIKNPCNKQDDYYLNIRAQCDLLRGDKKDKIELYCLKGSPIKFSSIKNDSNVNINKDEYEYSEKNGEIIETIKYAIIPFINGGKIIKFTFSNMKIFKWRWVKNKRIGRLLNPYTSRIQQKYGLYIQRLGQPRIPKEAIFSREGEQ